MNLYMLPETRRYLKAQISTQEGFRQFPYRDTRGILTIAYGRNLEARGISQDEGLTLLDNDLMDTEKDLAKCWPYYAQLSDVRKVVMVDMAYNLGVAGLMEWRPTLALIEQSNFKEAAEHMRNSVWEQQVHKRADILAQMMETGVMP